MLKEKVSYINKELDDLTEQLGRYDSADTIKKVNIENICNYNEEIEDFLTLRTVTNGDLRKIISLITVDREGEIKIFLMDKNVPTAIVEVVDPIILNAKVREADDCCCCCCCCCGDVPQYISNRMNGNLCDSDGRFLTVSLGVFSIVRILRPAQYLIHATEYCVPDKICVSAEDDNHCAVFRSMAFPTSEFCPPDFVPSPIEKHGKCGCGS